MNATSNPVAIEMIDKQIASTKMDIESTEDSIRQALYTLQSRTATVVKGIDENLGIFDPGLTEAAVKVERYVQQRTSQYEKLNSLMYVRKAAGGE